MDLSGGWCCGRGGRCRCGELPGTRDVVHVGDSPVAELGEDRHEAGPGGGQGVVDSWRDLVMIVPGDDPVRFEIAQRSCEGLLRDAADAAQQLTVAVGSVGDRPLVSMIPFDQKKMIGRTSRATGTITVARWSPAPYDPTDGGPTLVQIEVEETFHGDIEGEGRALLLQCLRADGSASFVGLERVTGTVAGRHGTFVLQDAGSLDTAGRVEKFKTRQSKVSKK